MSRHFPALLFLVPLFGAISMPVVCLKHRGWSRPIALGALWIMVGISIMNLLNIVENGEIRYAFSGWASPMGIEWVADALASLILVALSLLGLLALVFAGPTAPKDLGGRIVHFYTLILLLISSLTGIVFAGDLFNLFVFLEVAALASYALVGVLTILSAFAEGYAAPFWPAAGLGLAALLILGRGCWPGIWLGSLLIDLWMEQSSGILLSGVFNASASSLQAVIAATQLPGEETKKRLS